MSDENDVRQQLYIELANSFNSLKAISNEVFCKFLTGFEGQPVLFGTSNFFAQDVARLLPESTADELIEVLRGANELVNLYSFLGDMNQINSPKRHERPLPSGIAEILTNRIVGGGEVSFLGTQFMGVSGNSVPAPLQQMSTRAGEDPAGNTQNSRQSVVEEIKTGDAFARKHGIAGLSGGTVQGAVVSKDANTGNTTIVGGTFRGLSFD